MILFALLQEPSTYLTTLAAFAVVTVIFAVIPIRGDTGQHAGAGPGAVMVWQLSAALEAERSDRTGTETGGREQWEDIGWPEDEPAEYVGRHRLWGNIDEHPPCPIDIRLGEGFPWSRPVN